VQTGAVNRYPSGTVMDNLNAHRLKGAHRRQTILAFQKTADLGRPLRQRAEHNRAVRNRLVARHAHRTTHRIHRRATPILSHKTSAKRKTRII